MKILFSITISLLCAITIMNAQSCLPEGITFSSQQQIDDFQTNYPGCTEIEGFVRIDEAIDGDITSLQGLMNIQSIGGYLRISGNQGLGSFYGLSNITSIGGYVRINDNAALQFLNALGNLVSIGGYLKILANDELRSIYLQNLTNIGDELNISGNDMLQNLDGLHSLTSIGGYLRIAYSESLTDIHGIEHIFSEYIESNDPAFDDLVIIHNPLLSHCAMDNICLLLNDGFSTIEVHDNAEGCNSHIELESACASSCLSSGIAFSTQQEIDDFSTNYPSCSTIAGDVRIDETNAGDITNIDGLSQVVLIKGDLEIFGNSGLTNLNGLGGVQEIEGWFGLGYNDALVNLEGLQNLNNIEYGFEIHNNPSLINLNGLEGLSSVGGRFYVSENPALVSLEGLDNLAEVKTTFWIASNDALSDLDGLQSLAVVGEFLDIASNDNLTSLEGLESLETISYIAVSQNESLSNLAGLESLQTTNEIRIQYNQNLMHLTGLENLQTVDIIIIESNPNLSSLTGFEALTDVGYFFCNNNPSLAYCANEPICTLIENLSPNAFGFADNALGCNSTEEIEQACQPICLENGITFSSQQQINDFAASYANCSTIIGDVIIDETNIGDIIDLSTLSLLTTIEGDLQISGNFSLSNLSGLDNLTTLNGSLRIFGNAALSNISALQNIDPNTVNAGAGEIDIEIYSNPQLSQCALNNICDLLQQAGSTSNIHNNVAGCNTAEEVETACLLNPTTDIDELETGIHLYPNPVSDVLIVELKEHLASAANIKMSVYSSLGTSVAFESKRINGHETSLKLASATPAGIYLLRISDGSSQFTSTFVFTP